MKVDGATPTRWLSKGQWYINTCELRHLLSRSYVFFVLSKNGISLSPNHILGRFLPKHLFKETSKILQNSSITWQKWRDPKPIFPDDLDRTDPLFSLVKEVYHWRLSNPNTLVLLLLFLQPFNQREKLGILTKVSEIYTQHVSHLCCFYILGNILGFPTASVAVTFPSQGVTHETPPRQSWERYSSSPHVGGKGVGDLADLDLAASFEMIGFRLFLPTITRWCQLKSLFFSSRFVGRWSNVTSIFLQMGWWKKNSPVEVGRFCFHSLPGVLYKPSGWPWDFFHQSEHLGIDGWNTMFPFGIAYFSGVKMLVSGSVIGGLGPGGLDS